MKEETGENTIIVGDLNTSLISINGQIHKATKIQMIQ